MNLNWTQTELFSILAGFEPPLVLAYGTQVKSFFILIKLKLRVFGFNSIYIHP